MQNVIHTYAGRLDRRHVEQIGFAEVDFRVVAFQIFATSGFKVVEAADLFAAFEERAYQG